MPADASHPAARDSRANNIGTLRMTGALVVLLGHAFTLSSPDGRTRDAVSAAIVSWKLVEKPALGLKGRLARSRAHITDPSVSYSPGSPSPEAIRR